jgi:hypothetical protein
MTRRKRKCVIDTMVLQKANAPLQNEPGERSQFVHRLALLKAIQRGDLTVLISKRLQIEYNEHIRAPRNTFIQGFLALLTAPNGPVQPNWDRNWTSNQQRARKCRFPPEDDHVLRTAILEREESTIYTEEDRMLRTDECIHRQLAVHVSPPPGM